MIARNDRSDRSSVTTTTRGKWIFGASQLSSRRGKDGEYSREEKNIHSSTRVQVVGSTDALVRMRTRASRAAGSSTSRSSAHAAVLPLSFGFARLCCSMRANVHVCSTLDAPLILQRIYITISEAGPASKAKRTCDITEQRTARGTA
jgi:hypothetical protein